MREIAKDLMILAASMTFGAMAGLAVAAATALDGGAAPASMHGACTLIGICLGSVAAQVVCGRVTKRPLQGGRCLDVPRAPPG